MANAKKGHPLSPLLGERRHPLENLLSGGPLIPETSIPSSGQLKRLIETAFWASLQKEEGRSLAFTLSYEDSCTIGTGIMGSRLEFDKIFDVHSIKKLAPAIPRGATIVVAPGPDGELRISGLDLWSGGSLQIRIIDPGRVIVTYIGTNFAWISEEGIATMRDERPILDTLWQKFNAISDPSDGDLAFTRFDVVGNLVRAVRHLGHGGILVIARDGEQWEGHGYEATVPFAVISERIKSLKEAPNTSERYVANEFLEKATRDVAQLAAVDGALFLTSSLDVMGFGMKLEPKCKASGIPGPPLKGGMRHESAARYAFDNNERIAFVVSEDGPVTAFTREDDKEHPDSPVLRIYEHLELTLF